MSRQFAARGIIELLLIAFSAIVSSALTALLDVTAARNIFAVSSIFIFATIVILLSLGGHFTWAQVEWRYRILNWSQRVRIRPVLGVMAGILVCLGLFGTRLYWAPLIPGIPGLNQLGLNQTGNLLVIEGSVLVLVTLIVWRVLHGISRMSISAARCYYVLRSIDRQATAEYYSFGQEAGILEVRRVSRILDYLASARKGPLVGVVLRRRLGYELAPKHLPPSPAPLGMPEQNQSAGDHPDTRVAGGNWPEDESGSAHPEAMVREQQLADWANFIWEKGAEAGCWRKVGETTQAVQIDALFGNQLDDLFNGGKGYRVYSSGGPKFVTMVIKGTPGAGKSTLALQMSVTLAKQGNYCVYYSLEEEREALLQAASNFGWGQPDENVQFTPRGSRDATARRVDYKGVIHTDNQAYRRLLKRHAKAVKQPADAASTVTRVGAVLVSSLGSRAMSLSARKRQLHKVWNARLGDAAELPEVLPRCVVIDSLEGFANVGIDDNDQSGVPRDELLNIKDFFRDRCQMLVILVEDDGTGKPGFVDFVADVVVQLGRDLEHDYTILSAEILKARNQSHALGKHQIKIRSLFDIQEATGSLTDTVNKLDPGIGVFPSLHFRLFESQHLRTFDDRVLSTGLSGLDAMLNADPVRGGLRRQSTTALLGATGTGKSLIAMNFLIEGVRENTPTLLLSLSEDAGTITSRTVPQQRDRMRFSWQRERGADDAAGGSIYHQFEWELDGVARWSAALKRASTTGSPMPLPLRIPYLFKDPPVSPEKFADKVNEHIREQADAVKGFLNTLAEACGPIEPITWDRETRRQLRDVFVHAWDQFEMRVGDSLLLVRDHNQAEQIHPKRLVLLNDEGETNDPPPCLAWDSRAWDGTNLIYDTGLLVVRDWRPGNITPEEFIHRLLRVIGEPNQPSRFERLVLDDVSQLRQRFPLLADSRLFLPTLIDIAKATGITSLFLADADRGGDKSISHGLSVMANHIIDTKIAYLRPSLVAVEPAADAPSSEFATPTPMVVEGEVAPEGKYSERIVLVEIEARPGNVDQWPHQLRVMPPVDGRLAHIQMPRVQG